jgi:hypothetical protein
MRTMHRPPAERGEAGGTVQTKRRPPAERSEAGGCQPMHCSRNNRWDTFCTAGPSAGTAEADILETEGWIFVKFSGIVEGAEGYPQK